MCAGWRYSMLHGVDEVRGVDPRNGPLDVRVREVEPGQREDEPSGKRALPVVDAAS